MIRAAILQVELEDVSRRTNVVFGEVEGGNVLAHPIRTAKGAVKLIIVYLIQSHSSVYSESLVLDMFFWDL